MNENKNKGGKIVLLIFLLVCSGLGIAAFAMAMTKCKKDGFKTANCVGNADVGGIEEAATPGPMPGCVPEYGQCGGQGWKGSTQCCTPYVCNKLSKYYSECLPGTVNITNISYGGKIIPMPDNNVIKIPPGKYLDITITATGLQPKGTKSLVFGFEGSHDNLDIQAQDIDPLEGSIYSEIDTTDFNGCYTYNYFASDGWGNVAKNKFTLCVIIPATN